MRIAQKYINCESLIIDLTNLMDVAKITTRSHLNNPRPHLRQNMRALQGKKILFLVQLYTLHLYSIIQFNYFQGEGWLGWFHVRRKVPRTEPHST